MTSQGHGNERQKSGERVKINVGGTIFETTVSTLTRVDNTVLSAMVADRWRNQKEIFVDRNPAHFAKVLDYLRDGENVSLPSDYDSREALRKEADFYNLPGLAKMCLPCASTSKVEEGSSVEMIRAGDIVHWRKSVVEYYVIHFLNFFEVMLTFFASFLRRRAMNYYRDINSRCTSCGSHMKNCVGPTVPLDDDNGKKIAMSNGYWELWKKHMLYMEGKVVQADIPCCDVQWGREMQTHVPLYALSLVNPKKILEQQKSS